MHVKKIFFPLIAVAALFFSGCEQPADPVKNDNPGTNTPPAVESRYTLKSIAGTLTSGRVNTTLVLNDDGTGTMTQAVSPLRNGDFTWGIVKMDVQESSRATVSVDSITITPKEYPDETFQMQILEINGKFSFKVMIEGQSIYFDSDATPPAFDIDPAELTLEAGAGFVRRLERHRRSGPYRGLDGLFRRQAQVPQARHRAKRGVRRDFLPRRNQPHPLRQIPQLRRGRHRIGLHPFSRTVHRNSISLLEPGP